MLSTDSIIIISDEEEDASFSNDSVMILEDETRPALPPAGVSSDQQEEDLLITFCQEAQLLPHARYDCSTHTFTPEDAEISSPAGNNQLICPQCYCYICDRPAGECQVWTVQGVCHCNSHKHSVFWRNSRAARLLGALQRFSFNLLEVDAELRLAESLLLKVEAELAEVYASFLRGTVQWAGSCSCSCHTHQQHLESCSCQSNHQGVWLHDYLQVYQCVGSFLDRAEREEREKPRAAAVMRLGAAQIFLTHAPPPGMTNLTPQGNSEEGKFLLLKRVTEAVQRQLVLCHFKQEFSQKLQTFYHDLHLPPRCAALKHSLRVRYWKDPLLVSVLLGQNVTGRGQGRGRKDVLIESAAVVLHRTHHLQLQNRYWELTRYLKVVQTDKKLVQAVCDLIPLYQCKSGNIPAALHSPFSPSPGPCCAACRMTPDLYHMYLRIFTTATAPASTLHLHTQPLPHTAVWEPIRAAAQVNRADVVRFAVRILMSNTVLYSDSQCWLVLLHMVNISELPQPDADFLQEAVSVTTAILLDRPGHVIPRFFRRVYPDQALLLLVTACLARCMAAGCLSSTLPILEAYKVNLWCLDWLAARCNSHCPKMSAVTRNTST